MKYDTRALLGGFVIVLAIVLVIFSSLGEVKGSDAAAIWLAGRAFAAGQFDQIYVAGSGLFAMVPPSGWGAQLEALGAVDRPVYPFVYPPLWAWFAAHVLPSDLEVFGGLLQVVNVTCLLAMVWLSLRICGRGMSLVSGGSIAFGIVVAIPMALAVVEMQPQIFVSFLVLFALERHLFGADKTAGAMLALAAAIKLYPLLFVLMLAARRSWSGVTSFLVAGLGLGLLSIAVAGWPLHQTFLLAIGEISDTVLLTGASPNLNASLANLFFLDEMTFQVANVAGATDKYPKSMGWYFMARPPIWAALQGGALLLALGACFWLVSRIKPNEGSDIYRRERVAAGWAVLSVVLVLFAPLSWFYYHLVVIFLQPLFFPHMSLRAAFLICVTTAILMSPLVFGLTSGVFPMVYFGTLAGGIWLIAFLRVSWGPRAALKSFPAAHSST